MIEPALEAEVERLRQALTRIGNMPNGNAEWNEEYRQGYDKAMSRVRAEVARYAPDRTDATCTILGGAAPTNDNDRDTR